VYSPLQVLAAKPLSQADIVRHADLTNRTAFGLVQACLEAEVPPGLVANVFLYYWLRASTINANVPVPFFQTLERHWDIVVERVAARKPSPGPPPERRCRLLLRLTSPRTWRMGGEAWLPWAKAPPSASRGCSCAAPLVLAACCTPVCVCISLSFVLAARCPIVYTRLSRRPSAALTALQELLYQSFQALVAFASVTPSSLPPSSSSRAGCPSPATRPVRALRCEPAACRRHPALASRWRGACGPTPGAGISGQGGSRVAWGGRTQSVKKAV
jgi:hypothetical protein